MIKVYQNIIDRNNGNCMQAAIASLFELKLEEVPHFTSYGHEWFHKFHDFIKSQGYEYQGVLFNYNQYRIINKRKGIPTAKHLITRFNKIKKMEGINGYFYASVYSPKFYNPDDNPPVQHAVIIDKNFNVVHDVNPNNQNIINYPESKKLGYNGILDIYLIEPIKNNIL